MVDEDVLTQSSVNALKEWAAVVGALASGRQAVMLRKGGIREPEKHFGIERDRFFLYPTFDHQQVGLVRPEHHDLLQDTLGDGQWEGGNPPENALSKDGEIPQPDAVRITVWAELHKAFEVTDPAALKSLERFHIWTFDYAEKRLKWKPRQPLHILLLRVYQLPEPSFIPLKPKYAGCRSWIDIEGDLQFTGDPVIDDDQFALLSDAVVTSVGRPEGSPLSILG